MPETYRVLITGSRDWSDYEAVLFEISALTLQHLRIVIVHGAASGADGLAVKAAHELGLRTEPHPADWRPDGIYDPSAGFRRNAEMVAAGADVCVAFLMPCSKPGCRQPQPHGSHGASNCADLAEKAGIETRRFTP